MYNYGKPMFYLTAQKMKFSITDFFSKCDQIRRKMRIWPHLLKKSLMENFILYSVLNCQIVLVTRFRVPEKIQLSEAYLEACQTSTVELLLK